MIKSANNPVHHPQAPLYHPREGGDPARRKAAINKGRLTATDQTPAFAGVVMFIIAAVIFFVFGCSHANAMMLPVKFFVTEQQFADFKGKADQGDIDAAKQLAKLYVTGFITASCSNPDIMGVVLLSIQNAPIGTTQVKCPAKKINSDDIEGLKYLKPVANEGDAWAQTYMGWLYYQGKGVSQDYASALKWFTQAADQGYPYAEDLIGRLYRDGHGVLQNYTLAAEYFKKATLQYTGSYSRLGSLYFTGGPGFPQDYEKAYFWMGMSSSGRPNNEELVLADAEQSELKKLIDLPSLWQHLTPEQIERVKKQIRDYKMPEPTKWSPEGAKRRWLASQSNQTPSQPTNMQNHP